MEIRLITASRDYKLHVIVVSPDEAIVNYMESAGIRYLSVAQLAGFKNQNSKSILIENHDDNLTRLETFLTLIGYTIQKDDVSAKVMSEMLHTL